MSCDQRASCRRDLQSGLLRLQQVRKKADIGMAIHGHYPTLLGSRNLEASLLHANWARQPVGTARVQQEQQVLAFSVSSRLILIANIPYELPECQHWPSLTFELLRDSKTYDNRGEICKLRMRFNADACDIAPNDGSCLLGQLNYVPGYSKGASLSKSHPHT